MIALIGVRKMNDKQIKEWTFKVYNQLKELKINKNDEILFLLKINC